MRNITRANTRWGGGGGPIVQRSLDGRGLIFPRVLSYVHCEPMLGRGAEIRIYHTYCGRGHISPRFRGKYIVLAIRHTSGRKPILVRVKISPFQLIPGKITISIFSLDSASLYISHHWQSATNSFTAFCLFFENLSIHLKVQGRNGKTSNKRRQPL